MPLAPVSTAPGTSILVSLPRSSRKPRRLARGLHERGVLTVDAHDLATVVDLTAAAAGRLGP